MKYRRNHKRASAGFVTLSGLVLGLVLAGQYEPSEAIAGDDKIFAPQFCLPLELNSDDLGNQDIMANNTLFRVDAIVQNEDVDYQTFICPLVRDIIEGDLDAAWVRVGNSNENPGNPPICCVHSVSPQGGNQDFACEEADDDEERQSIALDLDGFVEYDNGHYVVTCELGFGDAIYSIRTSESD